LAISLGIITVLTTLGAAFLVRSLNEGQLGQRDSVRQRAFFLAEAAVDRASLNLRTPYDPTDDVLTGTLPTGTFQVDDPPEPLGGLRWRVTTRGQSGGDLRRIEAVFLLTPQSVFQYALFGAQNINVSGNAATDSYDSRNGAYAPATAGHNGDIGTNSSSTDPAGVTVDGSIFIDGQVAVGPDATDPTAVVEGYNPTFITGGTSPPSDTQDVVSQTATFPMPPVVVPPELTCTDLDVSSQTIVALPAGTYCYRNLTVQGGASLTSDGSGAVTVYLTGALVARGNSTVGYPVDPRQMVFLMGSSGAATLEEGTMTGTTGFYGGLYAPNATINISGNAEVFGSIVAKTVNVTGSAAVHYDEALTDVTAVSNIYQRTLVSWRDLN
jgi:hypothetical protein